MVGFPMLRTRIKTQSTTTNEVKVAMNNQVSREGNMLVYTRRGNLRMKSKPSFHTPYSLSLEKRSRSVDILQIRKRTTTGKEAGPASDNIVTITRT